MKWVCLAGFVAGAIVLSPVSAMPVAKPDALGASQLPLSRSRAITDMAVVMDGVITAAVVIISVGAEAEAITLAGGTMTTGNRHDEIGVGCTSEYGLPSFSLLTMRCHPGAWTPVRIRPNLSPFGRSTN